MTTAITLALPIALRSWTHPEEYERPDGWLAATSAALA